MFICYWLLCINVITVKKKTYILYKNTYHVYMFVSIYHIYIYMYNYIYIPYIYIYKYISHLYVCSLYDLSDGSTMNFTSRAVSVSDPSRDDRNKNPQNTLMSPESPESNGNLMVI